MIKSQKLIALSIFFTSTVTVCFSQNPDRGKQLRDEIQNQKQSADNYNTACYFALQGDKPLAIAYLKEVVYHEGYSDVNHIEKDDDLNSLHTDSIWNVLIKAAQENLARENKGNRSLVNKPGFYNNKALSTPYRENISEDEKVAGLSKLWSEVKYNFPNFDLVPHLNFDSLYLAYLPKVKQTSSTSAYYKVMEEFCAQLKDGHTNVIVPNEK